MKITRFTDYALRVLIYLALYEGKKVTIKDVAERYGISKNHLMKVVHELGMKGYIDTIRGKNGGMQLGLTPNDINIGVLVRMMEEDSVLVECFDANNTCVILPGCALKGMLKEAMECFFKSLEQYTLADLVNGGKREKVLKRILTIDQLEQGGKEVSVP